jgi:hypothetical protein
MEHTDLHRLPALIAFSTLLVMLWIMSAGDPCLIALARGGDVTGSNPIAITGCRLSREGYPFVTVGDLVVSSAVLVVLMGAFGLISSERGFARRRAVFVFVAVAGATCAFFIYLVAQQMLVPWMPLSRLQLAVWVGGMLAASAGVLAGVKLAKPAAAG